MTTNPFTALLADAEREQASAEDSLRRYAAQLTDDLSRMVASLDAGQHVNDLGVVQSRGLDIDRQCALRQERVSNVNRLRYHAARWDEQNATADGHDLTDAEHFSQREEI